jgi:hypothetical protein
MAQPSPDSLPVSPAPGAAGAHRIAHITLDEATILWRNADVEQERRVAVDRERLARVGFGAQAHEERVLRSV